jgi:glycosyltransferase involved in cell wall biosynthesis
MTATRSPRTALFWSYDSAEPSFRHRMLHARNVLLERGWNCPVETLPKGRYLTRILERRDQLRSAHVVVLHRIKLTPIEFLPLRNLCRSLVFDVDDAIYYRRPRQLGQAPDKSWFRQYKFARTCAISDVVMAGNQCLAERASRSARRVEILPTPVDLATYEALDVERTPKTVVWIGLPENLPYLELVRNVLAKLSRDDPDLTLRVVSGEFPDWPEVTIERVPWSSTSEASDLATAGIGIMPLTDDEWTHGKCAFKLLQYMAAALPCVGSAVGANLEVVEDGRTGFLAGDTAAWTTGLSTLLGEPARATAMGKAGRERVRDHYDTRIVSSRAADLIESVAAAGL